MSFSLLPDEVDVIGYTSNQSDSESLVSGHSGDSGVGVARARRPRRASPAPPAHAHKRKQTRVYVRTYYFFNADYQSRTFGQRCRDARARIHIQQPKTVASTTDYIRCKIAPIATVC